MNTLIGLKTADKVKAALTRGYKIGAIAGHLGISRPTFKSRLQDNCWTNSEREILNPVS